VAWGTIPLLVRQIQPIPVSIGSGGLELDAAAVVTVFWRVTFAALTVLLVQTARRRLGSLFAIDRRTLGALALNGVLLATHWVLFFSALLLTEVAVAELLTYTGPIYVAALTPLVLREPYDRRVLLPIVLGLVGMLVIVWPHLSAPDDPMEIAGALMAMLAAVGYALLMLNTKRLLHGVSAPVIMFWDSAIAAVVLLPLALALPAPSTGTEWAALFALGAIYSVAVVFVFMTGLKRVRADHAAVLMYLEPASAIVFAALLLGEPITVTAVVGGAIVVGAGVAVARLAPAPSVEGPPVPLDEAFDTASDG
jgi:drug/metabolite transporter (DMT)-like permease